MSEGIAWFSLFNSRSTQPETLDVVSHIIRVATLWK